jgi:hypothetical protein
VLVALLWILSVFPSSLTAAQDIERATLSLSHFGLGARGPDIRRYYGTSMQMWIWDSPPSPRAELSPLPSAASLGEPFLWASLTRAVWPSLLTPRGKEELSALILGKTSDQVHLLIGGPAAYVGDGPLGMYSSAMYFENNFGVSCIWYHYDRAEKIEWKQ